MKKQVPYAVLEKIQPLIDQNRDLIRVVRDPSLSFSFKDADEESDFYFKVEPRNEQGKHVISAKPLNEQSVQAYAEELDLDGVVNSFTRWVNILKKYAELQTIFDDPILKSYQDEFASYFSMADEQAAERPFDMEKQLLLDRYLDKVLLRLETQKETATEEQQEEIAEIVEDTHSLKSELGQITQNQTIQRIAKIWAKCRRFGIGLIKDALIDFMKDDLKGFIQSAIDEGGRQWHTIQGLLH